MKNADLMKLSKEEKPGLRIDRIIVNSILIISFFYSSIIHSQIPVNGFCSFKEFPVKSGLNRFLPVDFNSDGWRDLVLFSGNEKSYSTQTWNKNKYSTPSDKFSSTSFYDFHIVGSDDLRGKKYAFISRKERETGFVTFSKNGTISIQSRLKFDSYPSSIDVADINRNGKPEILISGYNFLGLSLISEDKNKLKEIPIDKDNLYSYSSFIDLDYDGYMDIVAVDMIKNSAVLFYNNKSGGFYPARSIALGNELKELHIADITNNGFQDLIFTGSDGFEVFQGDSVSSFNKRFIIKTPEKPDRYTIMDFNGDGFTDIAYINLESGKLYISFAKSINEFYQPITYFKRSGVVDINSFVDRSGRKLAILDSSGKIYFIEKVTDTENLSIPLAIKPALVGSFTVLNTRMKGLYFLDEYQMKINFLLSRKSAFDTYYYREVSRNYGNLVVDEINRENRTFYFYSNGENVIEMLRVNFNRLEFSKRILYAYGRIHDLKITSDRVKDMQTIYVLSENRGKLSIETFDFRDFRYVSSGAAEISSDVEQASIAFELYKEIFHIQRNQSNLLLKKSVFNRKVQGEETLLSKSVSSGKNIYSDVASFQDESINENLTAAWFYDDNNTDLFLYLRNRLNKITLKDFTPSIGSMKYIDGENENSLFLYDRTKGKLKRIDISSFGRNFDVNDLFESKNINSYIVDRLKSKKEFLIYTDSSDNLTKIKLVK